MTHHRRQPSDQHRQSFLHFSPNPAIELDAAFAVTYMNPAAQLHFPDLAGLGQQHPILQGLAAMIGEPPQDKQALVVFVRDVQSAGKHYEQQFLAVPATHQRFLYMTDITERKQAEADMQAMQAHLIQAEKLAAVGQLASGIAHELKNPLAVILQGVSYCQGTGLAVTDPQREALAMMAAAVSRADKIIHGLLTYVRPRALTLAAVNINEVLDASLALVEHQGGLKRVTVVKERLDHPPPVRLDRDQMQQVLINLMGNALQAMPDGGRLTLRTAVTVLTRLEDGAGRRASDFFRPGQLALLCEIEDTGTGIPPEHLSKAFDPFFTTKPPGEGTGLGLGIVRSIVDAHRGLITLRSQVGRGTTVRLTLPVVSAAGGPPVIQG